MQQALSDSKAPVLFFTFAALRIFDGGTEKIKNCILNL